VSTILAVGPRKLPNSGLVQVWVDSGSGSGHQISVPADHLALAEMDDGRGPSAIYALQVRDCRG
jgi:hypothetical protein